MSDITYEPRLVSVPSKGILDRPFTLDVPMTVTGMTSRYGLSESEVCAKACASLGIDLQRHLRALLERDPSADIEAAAKAWQPGVRSARATVVPLAAAQAAAKSVPEVWQAYVAALSAGNVEEANNALMAWFRQK
jgi:hypothetical protein